MLLFALTEGNIPALLRDQDYSDEAQPDAELRERSLLYVATTRARDEGRLHVSRAAEPSVAAGEGARSMAGHTDTKFGTGPLIWGTPPAGWSLRRARSGWLP